NIFFFSSRRRHTRSKRDWSSDVCSSDLDLTDKKVRVIGLNSSDIPWTTDSQGNYVHNRLEEAGFGVAQLKWLVDVALKLPDDSWQVVFFFHHPLSSSTFYNAQALIDIIKAFKNGGSVVINRSEIGRA